MPITEKLKNDSFVIDEPPEVKFEKLTCSHDDYDSDDGDDWFTDEPNDNLNHGSTIPFKPLVEKKKDPREVTIPCSIGPFNIKQALCDLGSGINLVPLVVYKVLSVGTLKPTSINLLMADLSMK